MNEHVCDWEYRYIKVKPRCRICHKYMDISEMLRRLNATERMSAKVAREVMEWTTAQHVLDILKAYANILEGAA